jgi:AbrB family looped-hinge helix DNA binding protein
MNYVTRISTKGQLVVPKAMRDDVGLEPGRRVSLTRHNGAIVVRAIDEPRKDGPTIDEVFARIAALNTYRGPRITEDDIRDAVQATAYENDLRTRSR